MADAQAAVQLPPGYEDAQPKGEEQVTLPAGYEDARPKAADENKLSDYNRQMTAAMSGQDTTLSADEKKQMDAGKKSGMVQAGIDVATSPLGSESVLGPVGRGLETHVMPGLERVPYLGRGIRAARNASSFLGAVLPAAAQGAGAGALEGAIRTHSVGGALHDAAVGGAVGAAGGALVHGVEGMSKLGIPPEPKMPVVSTDPFELTPDMPASESMRPARQIEMGFPEEDKTVSKEPFELSPDMPAEESMRPARQIEMGFPAHPNPGTTVGGEEGFMPTKATPEAPQMTASGLPMGSPTPFTQETHPFTPPPEKPVVEGLAHPPKNPLTSDTPLMRSSDDHQANVVHAGNPDELQAAFNRQQRHISGDAIMDKVGNDAKLAKQVRDMVNMTSPKNPDAPSLQKAIKNLTGEDWVISSGKKLSGAASTRIEGFQYLVEKGFSPSEIVAAAAKAPK